MEQLIADYKKRLATVNGEIIKMQPPVPYPNMIKRGEMEQEVRLKEKASCYRSFISELEREIGKIKETKF